MKNFLKGIVAGTMFLCAAGIAAAQTQLTMYYPIAVGGALTKVIDGMIAGRESEGRDGAVSVELKEGDDVGPSAVDGSVVTFLGGRNRDHLHPSSQAGRYQRYLLDVHTAFSEGDVALRSCSYLHNLRPENGQALYDEQFREIIEQWPMYSGSDVDDLASFAATNVALSAICAAATTRRSSSAPLRTGGAPRRRARSSRRRCRR